MTDSSLLELAESVLDGAVVIPGSHAPRAAAVLARQAFQQIVDRRCDSKAGGFDRANMRSKLIILTAAAGTDVGSRAEIAWAGLSQGCLSPAIVKGPPVAVFCQRHGTAVLPVVGPPGVS
ncbi:hypothetical protein ABIB25_005917 [Nakamurella sp. UYEF19]